MKRRTTLITLMNLSSYQPRMGPYFLFPIAQSLMPLLLLDREKGKLLNFSGRFKLNFVKEQLSRKRKSLKPKKDKVKRVKQLILCLKLLRKRSVEQGKSNVNGSSGNEFSFDHPRQSGQFNEDKSKNFFNSSSFVREEPQETIKPSFSRPPSAFRRRSLVVRFRYEPVVSPPDLDVKTDDTLSKPHHKHESESDSDVEPDIKFVSGLALEQEEEREEQVERELEMDADFVDKPVVDTLSEANFSDAEEDDDSDEKDARTEHTELKDLNALKLSELRGIAKARGMKGFSKLKKNLSLWVCLVKIRYSPCR